MKSVAEVAVIAAAAGAEAINKINLPSAGRTEKGTAGEFVTDADLASEAAIIGVIHRYRPEDGILAEESGHRQGSTGVRWIVDPLDGTVNFARGLDQFAVSVAAECDGLIVAGAICQPKGALSLSVDGERCASNRGTVAVAVDTDPRRAVVSFAVPYDQRGRTDAYRHLARIAPQVGDLRNSGSTVCDLAAVTLGRLDGFIGFGQSAWDIAAGQRMVEVAGGVSVTVALSTGLQMTVAGGERLVAAVLEWSGHASEPSSIAS